MEENRMDQMKMWLTKPLSPEDVDIWNKANNIIPEFTELFRDFCFSLYYLIRDTYLGDSHGESKETRIDLSPEDKSNHFTWCWQKTIENFNKEGIVFVFKEKDYEYFRTFFSEVFYEQTDLTLRDELEHFFILLFDRKRATPKSDLEMFTDVYKLFKRSLQI